MALYESALQERTRSLLRLEGIFHCLDRNFSEPEALRAVLRTFLELFDFCQRPELRIDLLLELDRLIQTLHAWKESELVNHSALGRWENRLREQQQALRDSHQGFAEPLRHQELLQLARGRQSVAGGLTGADLPLLAFWEQQEPAFRVAQFQHWRADFTLLESSAALILRFLRESLDWSTQTAEHGRFGTPLNPRHSLSLLQVETQDAHLYPKISGGIHRLHIQFLEWIDPGPSRALESSIEFRLALSAC
ncbi:cell division protein ZapD [Acidithiobacillus sp. IBUN Pt1247-S3]|uniref:cell division protein ZapD n=1 Tax=Acidithiobacillus sp. IBUN Pt1247-S3 TaxID=3166642 RepID=UPI0034E4EA2B